MINVFSVFADSEPEDANLSRDFNDCLNIPNLIQLAHQAGSAGEPFEMITLQVDEI